MKILVTSITVCALLLAAPVLADPPAASASDLLQQRLEKLSADLSSSDAGVRAAAAKTLGLLQRSMIESLTSYTNDPDPEVRARVADLLVAMQSQVRRIKALAHFSDAQRKQLAALEVSHPEFCKAMLGAAKGPKLSTLKEITRKVDRQKLFEPLIILGLFSQYEDVKLAAIDAVTQSGYDSPQAAQRLVELCCPDANPAVNMYNPFGYGSSNAVQGQALAALQKIQSTDSAVALVAIALSLKNDYTGRAIQLGDTAAQSQNLRLIPTLLPTLDDVTIIHNTNGGTGDISYTNADLALYILVKLVGQDVSDYNIYNQQANPSYCLFGFQGNEKRTAAIKRFRDWWEKNKSQPKYKDLKPIAIPDSNRDSSSDTID